MGFRSELEAAGRGERTALMVRVVHGTRLGRWAEQLAHAQGARLPVGGSPGWHVRGLGFR